MHATLRPAQRPTPLLSRVLGRDVLEAVRRARESGMTLNAIRLTLAEEGLNVSITAIRNAVRGVPGPVKRPGLDPDRKATVLAMVRRGCSYRKAAELAGVSYNLVWRAARHLGLPRGRRPGGVRKVLTGRPPCQPGGREA